MTGDYWHGGVPDLEPGAILLQATDISQANGLDPASLERAFFAPLSAGDGRLAAVTTRPGG